MQLNQIILQSELKHNEPQIQHQQRLLSLLMNPSLRDCYDTSTQAGQRKHFQKYITERLLCHKHESSTEKAFTGLDPKAGQLLEYCQLLRHPKFKDSWNNSAVNKFERLSQGIKGRVKATDKIRFIRKSEIPVDRLKDVTDLKLVCQV